MFNTNFHGVGPQSAEETAPSAAKDRKRTPKTPSGGSQKYTEMSVPPSDCDEQTSRSCSEASKKPVHSSAASAMEKEEWITVMGNTLQKQMDQHLIAVKQLLTENHQGLLDNLWAGPWKPSEHIDLFPVNQTDRLATDHCGGNILAVPGLLEPDTPNKNVQLENRESNTTAKLSFVTPVRTDASSPGQSVGGQATNADADEDDDNQAKKLRKSNGGSKKRESVHKAELKTAWDDRQRAQIEKIVHKAQNKNKYHRKWLRTLVKNVKPDNAPTNCLAKIVQSKPFGATTALFILINSITIGLETDAGIKNAINNREDGTLYPTINNIVSGFFVVELSLRILGEQCWFFVGPEWKWNMFDSVLVFQSVMQVALEGANLSFARILRALRMVRAARVIRVLRFFHELRRMVCSIIASFASLSWAFVLLMLIMYLVAICFCQAVTTYLKEGNLDQETEDGIKQWYNSLPMAMYSLMLSISGGADWYDIAVPLEQISWVYTLAYLLYVFFVIFGVLNVLVGVFLVSAAEMLDRDIIVQSELMRNNQVMKEMLQLFEDIDSSNSGFISWVEFQNYLEDEKAQAFLQYNCFDTSDPQALFSLMDIDNDGHVDSQEFIMAMMKIKGQAKGSDMLSLMQATKDTMKESRETKELLKSVMEKTFETHTEHRELTELVRSRTVIAADLQDPLRRGSTMMSSNRSNSRIAEGEEV